MGVTDGFNGNQQAAVYRVRRGHDRGAAGLALRGRPGVRAARCRRRARSALDPEVRRAAGDPAGHAAHAQTPGRWRQEPSTTTRSRCASSGSRSCRRAMGLEPTTVWSYGSVNHPDTFNYPAFTIEADWRRPVRVKWINELVEPNGNFLPHLLPVDQTLHWANPPGGAQGRDGHGHRPRRPYRGPGPIVTHLHGGHSDRVERRLPGGVVPARARNIPRGLRQDGIAATRSSGRSAQRELGQAWTPGSAVFQYDNDQRATTMWYHDHTLGMTRSNVYAGPAGFYLLRGGPADAVRRDACRARRRRSATRRAATTSRSRSRSRTARSPRRAQLFYPDNRAFFEGLDPSQLQIPFMPDPAAAARATSRRSGTRSSSATRSSSTAAPGPRSTCSSGAIACAS